MAETPKPLYCSEMCENEDVVRSFGVCPECNNTWDSKNTGHDRHYRNNAWLICDTCSRDQNRCVVCGKQAKMSE